MTMPNFRVVARKDTAELFFYDTIGEGFFGDGISSKQVVDSLTKLGQAKTLNVRINSPGGDVFEGFAIYNALTRLDMRIEVDIDAEAASIASIIAMAGDEIRIAENATIMIHDPYSFAMGTSEEMRKQADIMDQVRDTLVATYAKRTANEGKQVSKWMHDETWFSAAEAVEFGFADSLSQPLKMAACTTVPWIKRQPKSKASPLTPLVDIRRANIAQIEKRSVELIYARR